ncbi:MAG: signal peptidase I [bacterium]
MNDIVLIFIIVILFFIKIGIKYNWFSFPKIWLPNFLKKISKESFKEWVDSAFYASLLAFLVITFIGRLYIIPSSSMVPTLKPGDIIFGINKIWFNSKDGLKVNRGDILIFKPPIPNENRLYIKRLIGLPNEKVFINEGNLYINEHYIREDYLVYKDYYSYGPVKVPDNKYFFLGDNRPNSYDSHLWDYPFVDKDNIKAKALIIIFPFNRFKILTNPFKEK